MGFLAGISEESAGSEIDDLSKFITNQRSPFIADSLKNYIASNVIEIAPRNNPTRIAEKLLSKFLLLREFLRRFPVWLVQAQMFRVWADRAESGR